MSEIIYVLSNEAMPGYIKIGRTSTNLEERVRSLSSSTSVPIPFTVTYACIVEDSVKAESHIHNAFSDHRVNPRREFFDLDPERVVAILKLIQIEDITPKSDIVDSAEDQQSLNEARQKRARFNFAMVTIGIGDELYFSRNPEIKAHVISLTGANAIEYNGIPTSLSASAQEILGYANAVAGTEFWSYDGETLDARRRRIEDEAENSTL